MRKGVHFTVVFILLVTSLGGSLSSHRRQPLSYDNQREDKPQDSYDQDPYPDSFHDGDPHNGKEDVDRPYKYNEDTNADETDEEEDYKYNDKSKETTESNEYHSSSSDNYQNQDGQDPAEEPDLPPPSYPTTPPSYSCRFHYHSNSLPKGKTKVSYLHFIGAARSYKECADLCCQHGRKCQLGWLFKKKCFAVGCSSAEKDRCAPKAVPYDAKYSSSVVVMSFVKKTNHDSHNKDESSFSSTVVPQPSSSSLSSSSSSDYYSSNLYSHSIATMRSSSLSSVVTTTPSSSSSVIKATPHPKPPHGNHRLINNVLTIAVANKHPVITLPTDHIKIFSSTWPDSSPGVTYHYHWRRLFGPKKGNLNGVNDKTISLSHLVAGKYGLEVLVYDDEGNYGRDFVNITVRPEPHVNKAPIVIISPSTNITIKPSDKLILDASKTSDDGPKGETLYYQWDLISGPLQGVSGNRDYWTQPLLTLKHLNVGKYVFKLRVTDGDGAVGVAYANVTVQAEPDYPPTADAGESVLIQLPHDEVTLDGGRSKDDKGIIKYSWKLVKGNQVEMKGIKNKTVHVSKLEVGVYQFELTVTDASGQSDSATVTVDVQKENNQPPIAIVTGDTAVYYPNTESVLNGSLSTDDYRIIQYHWSQLEGPNDIRFDGLDKPVLRVSGLHVEGVSPTEYLFQLVVVDYRNVTNYTNISVYYHKGEDVLPVADAGPDMILTLPQDTVTLNGTGSHDGFGISQYKWIKSDSSPAIGGMVGGSDSEPFLMVSNLINGTYNFTLMVTNSNGKINTDNVTVTVKEDPYERLMVEVYVDTDMYSFTEADLEVIKEKLVLRIGQIHYRVIIRTIRPHDQHVLIKFYVIDKSGTIINSSVIYERLTDGSQEFYLGDYKVTRVEESVCQNPCSSHGVCDTRTKKCSCSTFWMENPFKAHYGSRHSNCDWSVLYVVLVVVGLIIICSLCVWLCCCYCMHRRRNSRRRRVKYAILDHNREEGVQSRMFAKDKSSLIMSETETEEEILFESKKKGGGGGGGKSEKQALINEPINSNRVKNNLTESSGRSKKTLNNVS